MINWLDTAIAAVAPAWGASRARSRGVLAAYEAANPSRLRKRRSDSGSGAAAVNRAGGSLRWQARALEQNNDLAKGVLDTLVNRVVGVNGISVEPMPKNLDGTVNIPLSRQLSAIYAEWGKAPDVTGEYNRAELERMTCRSKYRDGEVFAHILDANTRTIRHGSRIPLSVEMLEADFCPDEAESFGFDGAYQGIERNGWGKPTAYFFLKDHPGTDNIAAFTADAVRVSAHFVLHPKLCTRFAQGRGVSIFAPVFKRLGDVQDFEESVRVKEKVAASFTAYIKKNPADSYSANAETDGSGRAGMTMKAGAIFDDLLPGEDIGVIDSKSSGGNTELFRNGQLRAVCAGTGTHFASVSKNYNGTYTNARTELNESQMGYAAQSEQFAAQFTRPLYERVIQSALLAGLLDFDPEEIDMTTLAAAEYRGPVMPGPDPAKEGKAITSRVRDGIISMPQAIRAHGGDPVDTLEQIANWNEAAEERGVMLSSNPANDLPGPQEPETEDEPAEEGLTADET